MIKRIILWIIVILVCCAVLFVAREMLRNNPLAVIKRNNLENKLSGQINNFSFTVDFQGVIPAGQAVFENKGEGLYQGRRVYHLSAIAHTLGFFNKVYNAQAQVDSYVDADKLHTLYFKQTFSLPNKAKQEKEVLFDQDKNIMELKGVKREILPNTQDPLSAIFYIQHQDLEVGKVFDININTNQKNYQLYAKVVGRQEYQVRGKKVGVWLMDGIIRRRDKNPYHKTTMKLMLLDSPSRVPILIKTISNVGLVTARLSSAE